MKKIICKETISFVQNLYNDAIAKSNKLSICVPANILTGATIGIGRVRVTNAGKDSYLYVANDIGKEYMKEWKKDVGGVYVADCKHSNLDCYYKFKFNDTEVLLRRISDEELQEFGEKNLDHIKLGDFYYMIVKVVLPECSYISFDHTDEDFTAVVNNKDDEEEEPVDEEPEIESISLF